jgi:exopolyphosphatase/guanosine-5'-triphosphate,3'-diphosphate pyrophosphatase
MHLDLPRYDRNRVDGIWMTRAECEAAADRLISMTMAERAAQPCIGPDRADLVLAGAAILQAVQEVWPCDRVRVADRGLREGILLTMMTPRRRRGARMRKGPRPHV